MSGERPLQRHWRERFHRLASYERPAQQQWLQKVLAVGEESDDARTRS